MCIIISGLTHRSVTCQWEVEWKISSTFISLVPLREFSSLTIMQAWFSFLLYLYYGLACYWFYTCTLTWYQTMSQIWKDSTQETSAEGLSRYIREAKSSCGLKGIKRGTSFNLTRLLFVNDVLLFINGSVWEASKLREILDSYCLDSGMEINLQINHLF